MGKTREVGIRVGLVAIVIFAEIFLGIPWIIGKFLACFDRPSKLSTNNQMTESSSASSVLNLTSTKGIATDSHVAKIESPVIEYTKEKLPPGGWRKVTEAPVTWHVVHLFLTFQEQLALGTLVSRRLPLPIKLSMPPHVTSLEKYAFFFVSEGGKESPYGYVKRSAGGWTKCSKVTILAQYRTSQGEKIETPTPSKGDVYLRDVWYGLYFPTSEQDCTETNKPFPKEGSLKVSERIFQSFVAELPTKRDEVSGNLFPKEHLSAQEFAAALSRVKWGYCKAKWEALADWRPLEVVPIL